LLHANDGENLNTKFSANKQNPILKACINPAVMLPWQWHIRQLNYLNMEACSVYLHLATFGDKKINVLGKKKKKVNEAQV